MIVSGEIRTPDGGHGPGAVRIQHRDRTIVLDPGEGRRVANVIVERYRNSAKPLKHAGDDLGRALVNSSNEHCAVLAAWYDPRDEKARFRIAMNDEEAARVRDCTMLSVTWAKPIQTVRTGIDVMVGDGGTNLPATVAAPVAPALAATAPVTISAAPKPRSRDSRTGIVGEILTGSILPTLILKLGFGLAFTKAFAIGLGIAAVLHAATILARSWRHPKPSRPMEAPPSRSDDASWRELAGIVERDAPERIARADAASAACRALLQAPDVVDPVAVETRALIDRRLPELLDGYRKAATLAHPDERTELAGRLVDSIDALARMAETARRSALRDARADFDTQTRYIESRADDGLSSIP